MANDEDQSATKPANKGPWAWLSNRAGLIILVVLGAIFGLRLMSSWIKWMLIAMVAAAIFYLVKGALRSGSDKQG